MEPTHHCNKCGQPIIFAYSENGVRFPLDLSSDPRGTFIFHAQIQSDGRARRVAVGLTKHERIKAAAEGELLFLAHRATCAGTRKPGGGAPISSDLKQQRDQIIAQAKQSYR